MTPLPFVDLAHGVPFWVAYGIWVAWEMLRSYTHRSEPAAQRDDRGSYAAVIASVYLSMFLAFFIAFNLPSTAFATHREALYGLGVALMLIGVAFRAYAIRVLGSSFTFDVATRAGQVVCERGPYRYIRHPSYTGTLITIVGIGFALGNWLSLVAALAVSIAAHAYRVGVEEKVLCRDLGAPYAAYMQRTRRFVPFLF
ncbi:MAG: methyltransferase family protein [Vulcanimicrobiaceae bacterium]